MSHTNDPLRNRNDDPMSDQMSDPLDAVLLAEYSSAEQLRPSSGFALSVMDAIREEATVPPPIPFPWKLFLPGAIAVVCALVTFVLWAARHYSAAAAGAFAPALPSPALLNSTMSWIALALGLTLIAVLSSFRLAHGRSR
jgi:hypothetical protein